MRRTCDVHESWYIKGAAELGVHYTALVNKNERKKELIKNLQTALNDGKLRIGSDLRDLIAEFTTCQWSETAVDKIVGARRFHLLDALQYALDVVPKFVPQTTPISFHQWLKTANRERKKKQAEAAIRGTRRGRLVRRHA